MYHILTDYTTLLATLEYTPPHPIPYTPPFAHSFFSSVLY